MSAAANSVEGKASERKKYRHLEAGRGSVHGGATEARKDDCND